MVVIVYGYEGSGPGHWQRWLQQELRGRDVPVCFPDLPDPSAPQKDIWVAELARLVEESPSPVTLVAHSLGCWAVDHLIHERGTRNIDAALLVAPPSPFLIFEAVESFLPPPRDKQAWAPIAARSLLVGSDDDDFTSPEELAEIAAQLGIELHRLQGAGHINTASGYGAWPFALEWVLKQRRF
ncbi:MAG: alpha/beta fold hydrolase [Deltaproteobacteria bacterium]|nr:alpha/beta fold hydrolase [Deltaproteobacteria bacterium]